MVAVIPPPPALNGELTLFHTTDPLLQNSPVVVFYGPAASVGAPSSRIQVHIFTPAGLESYPRLAISPNSPYYAAVNALPREEQADEVCRGLAFGLSKYFADIPKLVKETWTTQVLSSKKAASAFGLFGDAHIAVLASRMTRIESAEHIIEDIQRALGEQCTSWLDLDIVLPPGSVQQTAASDSNTEDDVTEDELLERRYKQHAPLIKHFGEPAFIPTSKMKRAPSRVTAIGRSRILMRNQKEVVRKEMCELVDTEESYVGKVAQLVHQVALELRQSVERDAAIPVATPSERAVNELFPQCLEDILELNSNFLTAVKAILDQTEEAAIKDLQSDGGSADSTGVLQFSKCLHEWLPKFAKSYAEYMQAHSRASILLKQLKTSADSTVSEKIREIGEKRLSSLLIEPVQRLPRYTLYIDTIARQLPVAHPALKSLLKARDIVSEICSQDASGAEQANILDRLKRLVQSWPAQLQSLGRLVSVVDMAELDPPYEPTEFRGPSGILLLFSDCLVAVEKCSANSLSARALIAELDKSVSVDTGRPRPPDLRFTDAFRLDEVLAAEFMDNLVVSILPKSSEKTTPEPVYDRVYLLEGVYAGKASRFLEEMTKAKVEGRFTEALRESGAWEVRSIQPAVGELNLFSSIFERSKEQPKGAGNGPAPIQVVIEPTRHTTGIRLGERGVDTIVSIKDAGSGQWHLSVDSSIVAGTRDKVGQDDFIPVLLKRLIGILHARFSVKYQPLTKCLITRNSQILQALEFATASSISREASVASTNHGSVKRPLSPVKMLSNFLHTSVPTHQPSAARKLHNPYNAVNEVTVIPPPAAPTSRPTSKDQSRPNSSDQLTPTPRPVSMPGPELLKASGTGTKKLEDTLSTYLLALEARKGNFVGKVLRNRTYADELAVNELYNSLLEDPNMMVLAAQASIDVLFAAFENFLNIGWKEHFGAVLPLSTLREIQSKAESLFPSDFATYFRSTFNNMAPHNQRALKGVIKLLAELLDGTGNDGDRGILTAAFAETLFPEPEPYTFVSLLDRFVEDIESLFGESVQVQDIKPSPRPTYGHSRSQSANTGSLTSNTSSLRKKFGFSTVTRENSKSEHHSRVGSVWRQLSKSTRDRDQSSSISKGTASLHRTKSTDMDMRLTPKRPVSHDRPQVLGSFPFERPASQDASTFTPNSSLNTIGEVATPQTGGPPKKKRRSSLSDLKTLQVALSESPLIPPSPARRLMSPARELEQTASQIPTPTKSASVRISNARLGSPLRERSRIPSSFRKENSPGTQQTSTVTSPQRTRSPSKQPDEVTITSHTVVRRANITSNIPTLTPRGKRPTPSTITRTGLSERPNSGNAMKIKVPSSPTKAKENDQQPATSTTPTSSPPKKLRMQSPQKLRERLHTEQKALTATHSSLQDELSKIGDELGALGPGRMGSVRANRSPHATSTLRTPSTAPADLAARLTALESSLPKLLASLTQRTDAVAEDLRSSLAVSEAKARNLDELYREANAENEALYARFNDELGRVLKVVRGGEGVEELRRLVGEGQEEAGRLRRENARLKREVGGLRAQLRE